MREQGGTAKTQLALGTGAFALCFAVFGSLSAMMPILSRQMHLTAIQKSIAVAVPVLLGSVGRIPLGMLTDRRGGRSIFTLVMVLTIIPAFLMGGVGDYTHLIVYGFLIGIGLASFSVGVGFVSGWYSAERQGFALGVYGAGNIGQSLAAFGAPLLAAAYGFRWGFWTFGLLLAVWLVVFAVAAQSKPLTKRSARLRITEAGFSASTTFLPSAGSSPWQFIFPSSSPRCSASRRRTPACERQDSWCWRQPCAPSAECCRTRSAGAGF